MLQNGLVYRSTLQYKELISEKFLIMGALAARSILVNKKYFFCSQPTLHGMVWQIILNFFFYFSFRSPPGLLPVLGPLKRYMTPTLDAVAILLIANL